MEAIRTSPGDASAAAAGDGPPDDGAEFAAWLGPHVRVLTALAVREVGTTDADDVVQDALVRAWRRRATYRADAGSPRAWLIAILLDQARRRRTRVRPLRALRHEDDRTTPDPVERLTVEQAVRGLPTRQREVVTLFYLADLSVDDVARVLGISTGSVKSHLHEAREALRARLEQS